MNLMAIKSSIRLRGNVPAKTKYFVLFFIVLLVIGCSYYSVSRVSVNDPTLASKIESYKNEKYVILHDKYNSKMNLTSIIVDNDNQQLNGVLKPLDLMHKYYESYPGKKTYRFEERMGTPQNEVHFYTNEPLEMLENSEISLPFSKIDKIEVNNRDIGRTVITGLGVVAAGVVIVGLIIMATKDSCPFVYSNEGEQFVFEGELYPGAIRKNLERDDYLLLNNLQPKDGLYSIKVSNELKEIQYTNSLGLVQVNHDKNFNVLLDQKGNPQTISKPQTPSKLSLNNENLDMTSILKKDDSSYYFDDQSTNSNDLNSIILEFEKPVNVSSGKLVLSLKNSYWLDYVHGKMNEKFGSYFNEFRKKQANEPGEKGIKWMNDQGIAMGVYIKNLDEWELVEYINPVGPLAKRDLVIPIENTNCGSDKISIKLECGFMFWELDYAGMDYTKNQPIQISYLKPMRAIDETGKSVVNEIYNEDQSYLIQPNIGNVVSIDFKYVEKTDTNMTTTVFLKNRGYYTYIRDYKGNPDIATLKSFREKNGFNRFSKKTYNEFISDPNWFELIANTK